jgi:hypothetical protein
MFLEVLLHFRRGSYGAFDLEQRHFLNVFMKHFLHLFTQEDYVPSEADMERFIELNLVIANLVSMSSFRTTDPYIEILKGQKRNFAKILALYSARNTVALDRRKLFDTEPRFATQWYFCYWENYKTCCASQAALERLREHLHFRDERMGAINRHVHHAYFGCTYVDPEADRELKRHINANFQRWSATAPPIVNRPRHRSVALITSRWFARHSVYRCTYSFARALAAEFDLTLVHLGEARADLDTSLFKEVRSFRLGDPTDFSGLTPNDWSIAYFPDIGMNIESILLANMRLAPVQICGYGHPVSTFGSRIDYWLGGRDIESLEDHGRNYSERLILVPGPGVAPNRPDYHPRGLYAPGEVVLVNCAWTGQKINYPLVARLRRILQRSSRRVRFRFFTGGWLGGNAYLPLRRDIAQVLGEENAEVFQGMHYHIYMAHVEQGDLSLDSYPFGGYATATDAIYLRKPMVAWEGTKFFNRSAASLLRRVGMEELIASTGDEYEALALRLIHDDAYRRSLVARLSGVDLERAIFSHDDAKYVVQAFHYLVENDARLRRDADRSPILIGG